MLWQIADSIKHNCGVINEILNLTSGTIETDIVGVHCARAAPGNVLWQWLAVNVWTP
jgi:hypothetical protein